MMKILKADVERLVKEEYDRASKQHGERFHSPHEAYAVMLEELEEAKDEFDEAKHIMSRLFWFYVNCDNFRGCVDAAKIIQHAAENAAAEMIQLAAMAHKAQKGYENEPVD